jgi:hypothetical protein
MTSLIATDRHPRQVLHELKVLQDLGHAIQVCMGSGVDSTAMLGVLHEAGITPDLITFANTGNEKPETYTHARAMDDYLTAWGFPTLTWVKYTPGPTLKYETLGELCHVNETMPSISFGYGGCSMKFKIIPQEQLLKGVSRGPNKRDPHPLWTRSQDSGRKIIKLLGYDSGDQDIRRSKNLKTEDDDFMYIYPLQLLGYERGDCVEAIQRNGLPIPLKSACYFCMASKEWELYWLAAVHPELFEDAIAIEVGAMTGKNTKYTVADAWEYDDKGRVLEFGVDWLTLVRTWADEDLPKVSPHRGVFDIETRKALKNEDGTDFRSMTGYGLGRNVSWTHWAIRNGVIDGETLKVNTDHADYFIEMADELKGPDNALDVRSCGRIAA